MKYNAAGEKERNVIGRKISAARREKGYTLAGFSRGLAAVGVKISTGGVGKWETGDSVPNAYQLIAVCSLLGLEEHLPFFMEAYQPELNAEGRRKVEEYRQDLIAGGRYRPAPILTKLISYIQMPVSRLPVSAGPGALLDEDSFEMMDVPEKTVPKGASFGVRVSGDSMEPSYHDGQIVWVQQCSSLREGEVGVFIYDGEGYIKVYSEQEPDEAEAELMTDSFGMTRRQPVLVSYNPKYDPKIIRPEAYFQIVGRVL